MSSSSAAKCLASAVILATLAAPVASANPPEACQNQIIGRLHLGSSPRLASKRFERRYETVLDLINSARLDDAGAMIEQTFEDRDLNVYEVSRLWALRGFHAQKGGDRQRELASFREAVAGGGERLEPALSRSLLSQITVLELYLGNYPGALQAYDSLLASGADPADLGDLPAYMDAVAGVGPTQAAVFSKEK